MIHHKTLYIQNHELFVKKNLVCDISFSTSEYSNFGNCQKLAQVFLGKMVKLNIQFCDYSKKKTKASFDNFQSVNIHLYMKCGYHTKGFFTKIS